MTEWSEVDGVRLINGDCLAVMPTLEAGSVDLVLSDLPYGTTACKWDTVIPFEPLWACFKWVLKPKGAVVLTASQPFTSMLVMSNREWFKYDDVWDKVNRFTGFLDAKNRPLRRHESVLVFSPVGRLTYNPQMTPGEPYRATRSGKSTQVYQGFSVQSGDNDGTRYPHSVIRINADVKASPLHPTQKPVALFEYLVKTYSNEGETVLDATIGSGTTAVACLNTGRKCVGIERDTEHGYFDIACRRCRAAAAKTPLFTGVEKLHE